MVICESYMFKFSVSKDMKNITSPMKSILKTKRSDSRKGSGTFMSNTNYQGIENYCGGRVG